MSKHTFNFPLEIETGVSIQVYATGGDIDELCAGAQYAPHGVDDFYDLDELTVRHWERAAATLKELLYRAENAAPSSESEKEEA